MSGEWQFTDFYDYEFTYEKKKEEPKKMSNYTDITVLLDRSGSMSMIRESMETGFNNFIKEHKAVPSSKITLIEFDDINPQQIVYQCVPIGAAERLKLEPRGNTPLIDAFVKAIDATGARLAAMSESDRPDQVLFVVITDGQENASRTYKRSDVSSRVTKQHDVFKWQFVYLGANQDAIAEAASYGIPTQFAMSYNASLGGVRGMSTGMTANTVAYASESGMNRGQSVQSFTKSQRKQAVEDTNDVVTSTTSTTSEK